MTTSSTETSPHRELASVTLEDRESLPVMQQESLEKPYAFKPILSSAPTSLNTLFASRNSLKAVHTAFVLDLQKQKQKSVTFDYGYDLGYGDSSPERPTKRRRFERRNSKTPAMLMAMCARNITHEKTVEPVGSSFPDDDDDNWEGGLEIAQELVKHLQSRRNSQLATSPAPRAA